MRILFLAHRIPYPPNKGDKIRAFNILKHLSERHAVYLACLVDERADLESLAPLRSIAKRVLFDQLSPRLGKLLALAGMVGARPITVSYFHSQRLQRQVDELIADEHIDAVFCSSSPMAEYIFRSSHAPDRLRSLTRVMDLIDVDSIKWSQYAERSAAWKAWIFRYEARQLGAYETRIRREFHSVIVVSEEEKSLLPPVEGGSNVAAMSNGVDLDYFSPAQRVCHPAAQGALVFTGVMDYWPNAEGVCWFVEQVFPRIRAGAPAAQLFIVGNRPSAQVRRLASVPGVTVTGFVPDVRSYVAAAAACIVPLRIARGVQNKLLEAMAMGKAVVTTPQAFEGVRAQAGRDVVVADGEEAFAAAVCRLLQQPDEAVRIGRNARACVESNYSWAENLRLLDEVLLPDHGIAPQLAACAT